MGIKNFYKFLYGFFFIVIIPIILIFWSLAVKVPFKPINFPILGFTLAIIGFLIMLTAMIALAKKGEGLPMNAFPPKKLVTEGIYSILPHPIYFGFVLIVLGLSLGFGSATGLYLTTPIVILACIALVVGHERIYLIKKHNKLPSPIINFSLITKPFIKIFKINKIWNKILKIIEKIANSWHSKKIGSFRIINHGIYAGLAGGFGAFLVVLLVGTENLLSIIIISLFGLIGAALIGQLLVGSSNKLSRPFGYYGGVFGVIIGSIIISFFNKSLLLIIAAFCFSGPFIQGIGRIRCLIQGCCHGSLTDKERGIIIHNPHSRVCSLSNLCNKSIYPTQLYSIIGNIFSAIIITSLWLISVPLTMIVGVYMILNGAARFMEEGYRGEPLTKIIRGLRIYQWFAIISFIIGMLFMIISSPNTPAINTSNLIIALIMGLIYFFICWFALGIDFPDAKFRFSRLSG